MHSEQLADASRDRRRGSLELGHLGQEEAMGTHGDTEQQQLCGAALSPAVFPMISLARQLHGISQTHRYHSLIHSLCQDHQIPTAVKHASNSRFLVASSLSARDFVFLMKSKPADEILLGKVFGASAAACFPSGA